MTVFGLILFGLLIFEILEDWFSRRKDYVIASQFNYVFKALIYMAVIIAAHVLPLLPRVILIPLLALPILTIVASLVLSKYRLGLLPLLFLLMPLLFLAQAICNLAQPTSTRSR